jgi:hypothetical protein
LKSRHKQVEAKKAEAEMAKSSTERTRKWRAENRERSNAIDRASRARRQKAKTEGDFGFIPREQIDLTTEAPE